MEFPNIEPTNRPTDSQTQFIRASLLLFFPFLSHTVLARLLVPSTSLCSAQFRMLNIGFNMNPFKCLKWIFDVKCQRNRNLLSAFSYRAHFRPNDDAKYFKYILIRNRITHTEVERKKLNMCIRVQAIPLQSIRKISSIQVQSALHGSEPEHRVYDGAWALFSHTTTLKYWLLRALPWVLLLSNINASPHHFAISSFLFPSFACSWFDATFMSVLLELLNYFFMAMWEDSSSRKKEEK